jgi:hypothetical protein
MLSNFNEAPQRRSNYTPYGMMRRRRGSFIFALVKLNQRFSCQYD